MGNFNCFIFLNIFNSMFDFQWAILPFHFCKYKTYPAPKTQFKARIEYTYNV